MSQYVSIKLFTDPL